MDFLKKNTPIFDRGDEVQQAPPTALAGRCAGKGPDPSSPVADRWDLHVNLTKENGWSLSLSSRGAIPNKMRGWSSHWSFLFHGSDGVDPSGSLKPGPSP